jgi:iron complex outermembrane recepter protein
MYFLFMKRLYLILCLLAAQVAIFAQKTSLRGQILDKSNQEVVIGATIIAQLGGKAISDVSGNFSILATAGESITIASLGYETQTVAAAQGMVVQLIPTSSTLDAVVVVGTRNPSRTVLNTPVPVDVIALSSIQRTLPQNDLNQMLTYLAPSFQSNRQSSSDGTEHIDPASLRGMGPDQTLVLINGKRRHTTSLLNNQGTFGNGSVGTDLNAIPTSAIERVEVLRDGASAQYGSDAIAGVVNLILKTKADGLSLTATGGITQRGDGALTRLSGNYGLPLGKNGGSLNISADAYLRGSTSRTQHHNLIIFDQSALGNYFSYDFVDSTQIEFTRIYDDSVLVANGLNRDDFNFQVGDAKINNLSTFVNLLLPFRNGKGDFYAFAGYNARQGKGFGFRRLPSDGAKMVFSKFPYGFQPSTGSNISDVSSAIGIRYDLGQWKADFSNTLGLNNFQYSVHNTVNASLQDKTPTAFDAGGHTFTQNTINADISRYFENALSGLNLAFGGEYRLENYRIHAGEDASWRNYGLVTNPDNSVTDTLGLAGGAQSFPGFSPYNAVNKYRSNVSLYADSELDITKFWTLSGAGRFESYSDFGNTFNYKLATLIHPVPMLGIRGAVSTGFRAPSLHQQYFSYVSTTILSDGRLGQSGFFQNQSKLAISLGIPKLKQETSQNLSAGLTLKPSSHFNISVDAYQIKVKDRIVLTGLFGYDPYGTPDSAVQSLFLPFGADGGRFFTNAINTTTQGIDIVAAYRVAFNKSKLDITGLANFNQTSVDGDLNIPAKLRGQEDVFFSPAERGLIERVNPRQKFNLTLNYTQGKFVAFLSNVYFGTSYRNGFPFGVEQTFSGKMVTDASLTYQITKQLSITMGGNNIFGILPDQQAYLNSYFKVFKYAPVQMGMNGGFYFLRLNYKG